MKQLLLIALSALLFSTCKNKDAEPDKPDPNAPKSMSYSIVATYPHDTSSYTQGLLIYNGSMYEGTGNYGNSKLRKIELKTGKAEQEISLDKQYFGEGVTILNDTVYQLTYKEKKVFVYTLKDFKKIKEYDVNFEGWG
ncbi:MAG: glutaminyl-peptide cyclotransferase, partial [Chitinophagaceae bacterium]